MKRQYTTSVKCAHEGCQEYGRFSYDTRAEYIEGSKRRSKYPWHCTRHTKPDEVLMPSNLVRETVLVATPGDGNISHLLFWRSENSASGSGFAHGSGYKAWTEDFPPGTKLIVTARIELPAAPST